MPRRRFRRKRRPGRMAIYRAAGSQLKRDVYKLKRLINVEFKFHDAQLNATKGTTPTINQLSLLSQGDTTVTRDGSQVKCLSLQFSYILTMHASAVATQVRVMLIKDKQTNQSIYVPADVIDDATTPGNLVSPYNRDNRKRFTIMYDRLHVLTSGSARSVAKGLKLRQDQILRYDANDGTIADMTQSSYSVMIVGSEATNAPTVVFFSRLNFVDN